MGNILQIRNVDPLAGGKVEVSAPAPDLPSQGYTAIVRRGTQKNPFLGPDGWQQVEHAFVALESRIDGDRLLLVFGPDLVDNALRDEDVVELMIPELSAKDVVVWNGITRTVTLSDVEQKAGPVTRDVTGGAGGGADQVEEEPEEEIEEPEPDDDAGDMVSEPDPEPVVQEEPETKSSLRWVLILIPILLLIGAGGWYFFGMEQSPDEEQAQETTDDTGDAEAEAATEDGTEGEEDIAEADETEEAVAPDPEPEPEPAPELSTYEQGLAALEDGECDAARNLISRAIGEGSGEAALLMAEQQDSVGFEACMTETANDIRALSHYAMACEKGVEGAKEKLDLLEADLKKRSDEGNVTASEVLRVAFPKAREACS
ncbi:MULTISPECIES: hypothetical protein [unclassified Roseovarius]|uniref:hypothetical protein n=1 Tax=unclassified Roseovarius TaxID=2614913 RepID=UPI00273FD124|nr:MULTISPECIES: hypothetical protein [unclassified Roseovarius]